MKYEHAMITQTLSRFKPILPTTSKPASHPNLARPSIHFKQPNMHDHNIARNNTGPLYRTFLAKQSQAG